MNEVLWQLFLNGPTWDGDLISKSGRDKLCELGFASRINDWNFLTVNGVDAAVASGFDRRKNKHAQAWRELVA